MKVSQVKLTAGEGYVKELGMFKWMLSIVKLVKEISEPSNVISVV